MAPRRRVTNPRDIATNRAMIAGGVSGVVISILGALIVESRGLDGILAYTALAIVVGVVVGLCARAVFAHRDRQAGDASARGPVAPGSG